VTTQGDARRAPRPGTDRGRHLPRPQPRREPAARLRRPGRRAGPGVSGADARGARSGDRARLSGAPEGVRRPSPGPLAPAADRSAPTTGCCTSKSPQRHPGARGLARGQVFRRDGRLVASVVQEGLIRVTSPEQWRQGGASGSRRAATGVRNDRGARPKTVEDHDRRSCHRRPLTWRFSRVFPGPQHTAIPCRKARYRSRTEEARGSNPLTSTPPLMTSANAGHLHVRGRSGWPHNAWKSTHFATFRA
jgi:hypothetical protein